VSHSTSPFLFFSFSYDSFFWDSVSQSICQGLTSNCDSPDLLISASPVARITGMNHQHLTWWNFCLGWPQTVILHIPVSQVARITGVSHCTRHHVILKKLKL
jgi:hypothetical protein